MTGPHRAMREGRRVALVARYPDRDPAMPQFIPNHGVHMVAAALRNAGLPGLDIRLWDVEADVRPETLAAAIDGYDPDIVGLSAYLWSFPALMEVARLLKAADPRRLVVFGGPSARPSMFALAPFRAQTWVDVLVTGEGEATFAEVVALRARDAGALSGVAGLALRDGDGWRETPARAPVDLDDLPSPYVTGIAPARGLGVLQTYRGCPLSCTFCEWGVMAAPKRVRSADGLTREFAAMAAMDIGGALMVDAGLNLNKAAFDNLDRAARETGFLAPRSLICEVYPAKVRPEHLAFLERVGRAYVGVGLQSFDRETLAQVERSYDERRFDATLDALGEVAELAVEIILGLPGDSPARFARNFERARQLPAALRVYHCVVLPSALMVRSPPEHRLDFDPVSLKMRSCLGWSAADLSAACAFLDAEAAHAGGQSGEFFWVFPPPAGAPARRPPQTEPRAP